MLPGTRIMSPNDVKITPGVVGHGDGVVDPAHRDHAHRAARAVHELDGRGEHVLDAVAVDRVRVPAAHLHELEVIVAGELGDPRHQGARRGRIAILVDEAHRAAYAAGRRLRDTVRRPLQALGQHPAYPAAGGLRAIESPPATMSLHLLGRVVMVFHGVCAVRRSPSRRRGVPSTYPITEYQSSPPLIQSSS